MRVCGVPVQDTGSLATIRSQVLPVFTTLSKVWQGSFLTVPP